MSEAANRYMEQMIMTNHPIKNTILLYEKCVSRLKIVEKCFDVFRFQTADIQLIKLEETFLELEMQVDEGASEDIAADLYRLYGWILGEIEKMKTYRERKTIPDIIKVLEDLISGYSELLKNE